MPQLLSSRSTAREAPTVRSLHPATREQTQLDTFGKPGSSRIPDSQNFEQNEMAVVSHDQVLENLLGSSSY